jgi:electron transfer flavoprotein alpha subunit
VDAGLAPAVWQIAPDAKALADALDMPVTAIISGADVEAAVNDLATTCVDRIVHLEGDALETFGSETCSRALLAFTRGETPAVFLFPATLDGGDLAARFAAESGWSFLGNCLWLRPGGSWLRIDRAAYDDRVQETWEVPRPPVIATVVPRPHARSASTGPMPEIVRRRVELPPSATVRRRFPPDPATIPLQEADRIVAAGLGIGDVGMLDDVRDLARALGASVGVTRPLADRGWMPFSSQIGTTGVTVAPELYVAVGISGALQHVGGIEDDPTIVAVNTDPGAPIMALAHLAAIGDASEIVPRLTERLRQLSADAQPAGERGGSQP